MRYVTDLPDMVDPAADFHHPTKWHALGFAPEHFVSIALLTRCPGWVGLYSLTHGHFDFRDSFSKDQSGRPNYLRIRLRDLFEVRSSLFVIFTEPPSRQAV